MPRRKPTPTDPQPADRRALTSAANGRHSYGPVTTEGKAIARFNALKHGIHTAQLLLNAGPHPEQQTQLQDLYAQFHAELAPVGLAEHLLVERLFVCYWRLRRVLVAEADLLANKPPDDLTAVLDRVLEEMGLGDDEAPSPPASPALNVAGTARITRYEGPLEKAFYRALHQFLDLQQARLARTRRNTPATEEEK